MAKDSAGGGYAGQIKHTGTQIINAPLKSGSSASGTVKKGDDLRTGSK